MARATANPGVVVAADICRWLDGNHGLGASDWWCRGEDKRDKSACSTATYQDGRSPAGVDQGGLATAPEDNQPHGEDASSPRSTLSRIAAELQSCRQTSKQDQARDATSGLEAKWGAAGYSSVSQCLCRRVQAWVGPLLCCSAFVPACRILVRPWFAFGHPAVSRWPVLRCRPHKTSSFPPCARPLSACFQTFRDSPALDLFLRLTACSSVLLPRCRRSHSLILRTSPASSLPPLYQATCVRD